MAASLVRGTQGWQARRSLCKAEKFHIRDANIFKGVLQKPMHTPKILKNMTATQELWIS